MNNSEKDIDKLNDFLKSEIAAVETYSQAIEKTGNSSTVVQRLVELRQSHSSRAQLLRQQIVALGGEPAEGSGMWGAFTKLVEGGAKAFGEKAALQALEEGEDKGLQEYRDEMDDLSEGMRSFIASQILPEQQRSHDTMSRMKKSMM